MESLSQEAPHRTLSLQAAATPPPPSRSNWKSMEPCGGGDRKVANLMDLYVRSPLNIDIFASRNIC